MSERKIVESLVMYDRAWMGFNGYLLHVPRAGVLATLPKLDSDVHAPAVGLYPMKPSSEYPSVRYDRFFIHKAHVIQYMGRHRKVVVEDNCAILYDTAGNNEESHLHQTKLLRWERFYDEKNRDMWEITGSNDWNNHTKIVINDRRDPASWWIFFSMLSNAIWKGYHRHGMLMQSKHRIDLSTDRTMLSKTHWEKRPQGDLLDAYAVELRRLNEGNKAAVMDAADWAADTYGNFLGSLKMLSKTFQ